MRIIAGQFRSRPLRTPRGTDTRPTSDRLRETLFNVLSPRIHASRFADLYAGSGAVGLEALSRGAAFVWFAENAPPALTAIRANLSAFKVVGYSLEDRGVARLLQSMQQAARADLDIAFLDPPYEAADEYRTTLDFLARHHAAILAPDAVVIAEHSRKQAPPPAFSELQRTRLLEQGDAALSFYQVQKAELANTAPNPSTQ